MRWCAVAALTVAGGLIAAAASATTSLPDATLAPGPSEASASAPLLTLGNTSLGPDGAGPDAPLRVPPLSPFDIVAPFDPPQSRWGAGHRGIDIAASAGQAVMAPAAGYVSFAGRVVNRYVIVIRHDGALRSSFEPIVSTLTVGNRVRAGDVVGHVSQIGGHCSSEPCLHWGVRRDENYVDPLDVLAGFGPIRLLSQNPRTPRS